jgi:hypothetical protein
MMIEPIPLRDLDGRLIRRTDDGISYYDATMADADGVMFQCPLCAQGKERGDAHGRRFFIGAHYVICWFVGRVPDDVDPKPGRWNPSGTSLDDLTFVGPGAVSVLLTAGCGWHGFVKDGRAG